MSGKDVVINITGIQINEFGEEDCIELIAKGLYFKKNEAYYVVYDDAELTGMKGTTTSVKAKKGQVLLNRMGGTEQRQLFEIGKRDESMYITQHGKMLMGVIPSRVEVNLTDEGGSINLEYELEIGREKISDNRLSIIVREV